MRIFLVLPESAEVIDDMADDAESLTDEAADSAAADIFTNVCLYYNTCMINLPNKRIKNNMKRTRYVCI